MLASCPLERNLKPLWIGTALLLAVIVAISTYSSRPSLPESYRYPFNSNGQTSDAFERELAFYQERIRRNPGDGMDLAALAGVYLRKARVSGWSGWYLLAEQSAQRSLANLPFANNGAWLILAEIASARHDFAGALQIADQVLKQRNDEGAHSLKSTVFLAQGKLEQARQEIEPLIQNLPSLRNLSQRALIYLAQSKEALALEDFRRALSLEEPGDPYGSAWVRTLLGRYYAQHGQQALAAGLFAEALRISPQFPLALQMLGELETRTGDYRAAEGHFNQILFRFRDSATLYDHAAFRGLARIYKLKGDGAQAERFWVDSEKTLRRDVNSGAFGHQRELAQLLLERGHAVDFPEALKLAQSELKNRRDAETLSVLAWALLENGRARQAEKTIGEALGYGVKDAVLYYRAGQIQAALGKTEAAQAFYKQAMVIDPKLDKRARTMLGLGE
ncbi:MAG: tetratricopeptide repeat protein [Meiothermus silvanus]|nr:tetratricopeptide repeat protein [Allomeiothermus silvanus]